MGKTLVVLGWQTAEGTTTGRIVGGFVFARSLTLMLSNCLAYRTAQSHVHAFAGEGEELMIRHHEAMECLDCESFLQMGIDAFNWLGRADVVFRKAVFGGQVEFSDEIDKAIETLYKMWLRPCGFAEECVKIQLERGFEVSNLEEFRRCAVEVRAIVHDDGGVSDVMAACRDGAIEAHLKGETLEWEIA